MKMKEGVKDFLMEMKKGIFCIEDNLENLFVDRKVLSFFI
jgi:hypothetical protein